MHRLKMLQYIFSPTFYHEGFKQAEKLREFYSEHAYTHQLDSAINILLYLLYCISSHPYIHLIFLFISNCRNKYNSP